MGVPSEKRALPIRRRANSALLHRTRTFPHYDRPGFNIIEIIYTRLTRSLCFSLSLSVKGAQSARRQSLAKLHNLPLEAPITKVISLICTAQENSSDQVVQILDKVSEKQDNTHSGCWPLPDEFLSPLEGRISRRPVTYRHIFEK